MGEQAAWHGEGVALFGVETGFPGGHDPGMHLARLFGMIHERESLDRTIRKSFIISLGLRVQMIFEYPLFVGRNTEELLRVVKALRLRAETGAATLADWCGGDIAIIADDRPEGQSSRPAATPAPRARARAGAPGGPPA